MDLINDLTIARVDDIHLREIEYFHIKLDRHGVIYAEGAACETLRAVTAVNSDSVEFEEYRRLYGEPSLPDEPVAPVLGYNGGRARLRGRIRSAVSHVIDVRSKLEIVRDDLREERRLSVTTADERWLNLLQRRSHGDLPTTGRAAEPTSARQDVVAALQKAACALWVTYGRRLGKNFLT